MAEKERATYDDQLGLSRISALSDGVFSIVITLVLFDIKLPPDTSAENLGERLLSLYPIFFSFIATFVVIGTYWVGHHAVFRHIRRYDRKLLWINILFLLWVAFLPFPTSLLGRYGATFPGIAIYGGNLIAVGVSLAAIWRHATKGNALTDDNLDKRIIQIAYSRILAAPIVALLSIVIALFSPKASIVIFSLIGVGYLFPSRIDRISHKK